MMKPEQVFTVFTPVPERDTVIISDTRGNSIEVSCEALHRFVHNREQKSEEWKDTLAAKASQLNSVTE